MSPNNAGQQQRRLYVDFRSRGDASSLSRFLVYVLIDAVKNGYQDLDLTIYDYEKVYEVSPNEKFTMHMPIDIKNHVFEEVYR